MCLLNGCPLLGPDVSLSSSVVDFGSVGEQQSAAQTLQLLNSSSVAAVYQWELNNANSVFSIHPAGGTVPPQSRIKVTAVYRPRSVLAHCRRVVCLILHRVGDSEDPHKSTWAELLSLTSSSFQEPLFLDLVGSCHSELQKPATLEPGDLKLLHGEHPGDTQPHPSAKVEQLEGHAPMLEASDGPTRSVGRCPHSFYISFGLAKVTPVMILCYFFQLTDLWAVFEAGIVSCPIRRIQGLYPKHTEISPDSILFYTYYEAFKIAHLF